MRRVFVLLVLLALLALPALALMPAGRSQPVPPAGPGARVTQVDASHYPDVTVYVGVSGENGQPVGGLSARDFALTEGGQPVEIGQFVGGGGGAVSAVLVIDRSGSMAEADKIDGARDAAQAFVGQMRAADRTALIAFNSDSETLQPFTADTRALDRAIERIRPDGGTALYDSLVAGVDALASAQGRRALLLLTDGQDCRDSSSCPDSFGSQNSLSEAIGYAAERAQPVYVIGLGERGSDSRDGVDEQVLEQIARESGGEYFYAPDADQLAQLYRSLSAEIQKEYALTYRSPRPFYDGTRRDIQVQVGGGAAAGGYVERHLIDVRSDPLVGLLLLLPIAGALAAPALLRRRKPASAAPVPALAEQLPPAPAIGSTFHKAPSVIVIPPEGPRCTSCDAPLLHAGARFCAACGTAQLASPPAEPRRSFCDQCGRPMRAGARFCSACGATNTLRGVQLGPSET